MKINSPFEIAKKSMFYNNFIYNEIAKRHIEDNNISLCSHIGDLVKNLKKYFSNYENIFLVVIGEAVYQYQKLCNCLEPSCSTRVKNIMEKIPELFDFNKYQKFYDGLLVLSEKYNINAAGIPFPVDMADVIDKYSCNFMPPRLDLFNINFIKSFKILNFSHRELSALVYARLTEDDINKMKYQFIVNKIREREDISELDKNFFTYHSSQNKFSDIRIDSFIKYVIGLYCWDMEKNGDNIKSGYELYQEYQKRCNKCGGSKCFKEMNYNGKFTLPKDSKKEDFYCKHLETCKKFVRESYKLVSTCIKECNLYNSNHGSKLYQPQEKNFIFNRKKLSFFSGEVENDLSTNVS